MGGCFIHKLQAIYLRFSVMHQPLQHLVTVPCRLQSSTLVELLDICAPCCIKYTNADIISVNIRSASFIQRYTTSSYQCRKKVWKQVVLRRCPSKFQKSFVSGHSKKLRYYMLLYRYSLYILISLKHEGNNTSKQYFSRIC